MNFSNDAILNQVKGWTPPEFHRNKNAYISFTAFCPTTGKMKRKKIMLDHISSKTKQRKYANQIIQRLTEKLLNGWNPWIEQMQPLEYTLFTDICDKYHEYLFKQLADHYMREQTLSSYLSYLNIFMLWVRKEHNITYIYQLDKRIVSSFLDYVYIDRNNNITTRNNYLSWLKVFCKYLTERAYISEDPTNGLPTINRRNRNKNRDVIPDYILKKIHEYLIIYNKHYLLACQLLHYCFIRPKEMALLHIGDINLHAQTLFIHGEISKNHNDAVITLPTHVIRLMLDIRLFDSPNKYYIFSENFEPGIEKRSEKAFRDFWDKKLRKALDLEPRYKLYSLKDTGITNMLRANTDIISVRDQARHSSILITDIYTPKDIKDANKIIMNYKGYL